MENSFLKRCSMFEKKYRKIQLVCIGIFMFHFSVSHIILTATGIINFFPFYDWNLFSYNPSIQTWPMIRVLEINNHPVPPPGLVYHSGIVANANVAGRVPEQMYRLVKRLESNGPSDSKTTLLREEMEKNIFHGKQQVRYEVFNAKINVRDYFYSQTIIEEYQKWIFEYSSESK